MDLVISLPDYQSVIQLDKAWQYNEGYFSIMNAINYREIIQTVLGKVEITRIYFGQEFCERNILTIHEMKCAIKHLKALSIPFTFITPYVTETGLEMLEQVLIELVALEPECEIVVNDWGVLYLLKSKFPTFKPVMGRLLNKIFRDPRIFDYFKKEIKETSKNQVSSKNPLVEFTKSNLRATSMKKILNYYHVNRIEIDYPPQGLDQEIAEEGYVSLYLPFACITTGRICLPGSWGIERESKFSTNVQHCSKACLYSWLEMDDKSRQIKQNNQWKVMQKGNTVFLQYQESLFNSALEEAMKIGVDRIVFQGKPL